MALGYIRSELSLKIFILYILKTYDADMTLEEIFFVASVDACVNFFELCGACESICNTKQIALTAPETYKFLPAGNSSLDAYLSEVPPSVRRAARKTILKLKANKKNTENVRTETIILDKGQIIERLILSDGKREVFKLDLSVVNLSQASEIEYKFKKNPERIYNAILDAILEDDGILG